MTRGTGDKSDVFTGGSSTSDKQGKETEPGVVVERATVVVMGEVKMGKRLAVEVRNLIKSNDLEQTLYSQLLLL